MKTHLCIVSLLFLGACSSYTFKEMESISSKMSRFQPKKEQTFTMPKIPINNHSVAQLQGKHRFPASVNKPSPIMSLAKRMNNKTLYFATLLEQYYKLAQYSKQQSPVINSCPHFHSTLLNLSPTITKMAKKIPINEIPNKSLASTPIELYLPVTFNVNGAKVIDFPASQQISYLHKAINIHLQKMYRELITLCQTGSSASYYTFANLPQSEINLATPSVKTVAVLLKMPIFTNELLLNSLANKHSHKPTRSIASVTPSHPMVFQEVSKRLRINWFSSYIQAN